MLLLTRTALQRQEQTRSISLYKKLRRKRTRRRMLNSEFTPNSSPNAAVGKRQRLFNMMKTTKDVYLPTLTSSLSNLKAEASSTLKNYYYVDDSGTRGVNGGLQPLQDIKLLTYPSYTRMTPDGSYVTFVRGLVYTPGTMNRKNRLILSLCKQFFRPNSDPVEAEEKLESVLNNLSLIHI